jgi:hypothetical protein
LSFQANQGTALANRLARLAHVTVLYSFAVFGIPYSSSFSRGKSPRASH